ncbi:MAG: hypothetical protein IPM32_08885 [Ignavibacteriae bacterium]|nr:hypothetical protein [Ignavibacteriota bacterium]
MRNLIIISNVVIITFFLFNKTFAQEKIYKLDELVKQSDLIVNAKVISITPWFGADDRIYSDISLKITKVYKGKQEGFKNLKFSFLGGRIGTRGTTVLEYPHYENDVESMLFLKNFNADNSAKNAFMPVGLTQGKLDFRYENNKIYLTRDKNCNFDLDIKINNKTKSFNNDEKVFIDEFETYLELLINN